MPRPSRILCSLLLRFYPSSYRVSLGEQLESAMFMCIDRERRRMGRLGALYAWIRLACDAFSVGMGLRVEGVRQVFAGRRDRFEPRTRTMNNQRYAEYRQPFFQGALRDLRYSFRALRRSPGFALASSLTLALGIGAATAVLCLVNGVLIKPLPYPQSNALVSIWNTPRGPNNVGQVPLSATQFFTYREESRTFASFGLWSTGTASVTATAEPEEIPVLRVTYGTLQALGVSPTLGRWFSREDDTPGSPEAVLVADAYWKRRYGGDPSVIGRTIILDAVPRTVIGVMPPGFRFLNVAADVIVPLRFDRSSLVLGAFNYSAVGRLVPGATLEQATADVNRMNQIWLNAWPAPAGFDKERFDRAAVLRPLKQEVVGTIGDVLWVLLGMAGVVLVIACANVANLLLIRAEQRRRELAVRIALGAGPHRIARELLLESVLVGLLGGALGLGLTLGILRALIALRPVSLPRLDEVGIDFTVFAFAVIASLMSSVFSALIPVLRYASPRSSQALRVVERSSSGSRQQHRTRNALVVAQVSLALLLLVGAGLMLRSFLALRGVQAGFSDADRVQLVRLTIPRTLVDDPESVFRIQSDILARAASIPGVSAASLTSAAPMEPYVSANALFPEHQIEAQGRIRRFKFVSPGYFATVGTPLIAGRDFEWADVDEKRPVTVISENLARELWREPAAALGRRVRENPAGPWREIIGVVRDVFDDGLHAPPPAVVYWPPIMQNFEGDRIRIRRSMSLVLRSDRAGTDSLMKDIQQAVWGVNANLPLARAQTLGAIYERSLAPRSFTLVVLATAASMAMLLGLVGIYAVIATAVTQRTREIGIRVALGAPLGDVKRMFIRQAVVLASLGVLGGSAAAVLLTNLLSSMLFGVSRFDAPTYLAVSLFLVAAAAVASYIPARRATAVNPLEALRAQ